MRIGIITDSTCDLPQDILLRYHIATVPLRVLIGNEEWRDWRDIFPFDIYPRMAGEEAALPRTSPPSVEDFCTIYRRFLKQYDVIFSVHLSGKVSETFERSRLAAAELNASDRIIGIDSYHVNAVVAEMVLSIARDIDEGIGDIDAILAEIVRIRESAISLYSPHSLKWLVEGGRISALGAMMGNLLSIRPIVGMVDGVVARRGIVRRSQAIPELISKAEKAFGTLPIRLTISIAGYSPTVVETFKRLCHESKLNIIKGRVQMIGPVIGSHLGPDTVGLTAFPDNQAVFDFG